MISKELIKILEKRPEAEVLIIAGKDKKTLVVSDLIHCMAHTVFIVAERTPAETDRT
jgi:hypothetical protein